MNKSEWCGKEPKEIRPECKAKDGSKACFGPHEEDMKRKGEK